MGQEDRQKTGVENLYVIKQNKKLRCGYTTGSCAAAAARAAAQILLGSPSGENELPDTVPLMTPKGILLHLPVRVVRADRAKGRVLCAVRKDAGDDPDVTDGLEICAEVRMLAPDIEEAAAGIRSFQAQGGGERTDVEGEGPAGAGSPCPGMDPGGLGDKYAFAYYQGKEYDSAVRLQLLDTLRAAGWQSQGDTGGAGQRQSVSRNVRREQSAFRCAGQGPLLVLDGGGGVGRVTRSGLKQNIGEAAINPVPRHMIFEAAAEECRRAGYAGGLRITISVPGGEEVAKKTFNPRLGILGGISILGTTGIVEPMSEEALIESIRLEMGQHVKNGERILVLTPGNYGLDFIRDGLKLPPDKAILCSNFIGLAVDEAAALLAGDGPEPVRIGEGPEPAGTGGACPEPARPGNSGAEPFTPEGAGPEEPGTGEAAGILYVAHIGKAVKVAGGIMNTHSREGDCRAEISAACAIQAGIGLADAGRILQTQTTDEAVGIMKEAGLLEKTMEIVCRRVRSYLQHRCGGTIRTEAIVYNQTEGLLGMTEGAGQMLRRLSENAAGTLEGDDPACG